MPREPAISFIEYEDKVYKVIELPDRCSPFRPILNHWQAHNPSETRQPALRSANTISSTKISSCPSRR